MAGHAQLKFVMTECSKTQIRLTGLIYFLLLSLFRGLKTNVIRFNKSLIHFKTRYRNRYEKKNEIEPLGLPGPRKVLDYFTLSCQLDLLKRWQTVQSSMCIKNAFVKVAH